MREIMENTAQDVYESMMLLEAEIKNDQIKIQKNVHDADAIEQYSAHIFFLLIKRIKHGFYKKGEFNHGNRLEELVKINEEAIEHHISANSLKVLMNCSLYNVSLEDSFMELLKDYAEYIKPLLIQVIE